MKAPLSTRRSQSPSRRRGAPVCCPAGNEGVLTRPWTVRVMLVDDAALVRYEVVASLPSTDGLAYE